MARTLCYVATLEGDGDVSTHCHDVTANLRVGAAHGTGFGTDVLSGVENVWTGGGNDVLLGDDHDNDFYTGNPWGCLEGRSRVESVTGNGGVDEISFESGTAEHVTGTEFRDVVVGDEHSNRLDGGPGPDTLYGRSGNDRLSGGPGRNRNEGGNGTDTCRLPRHGKLAKAANASHT